MRARLVLETVERQMPEAGREVTIHALRVELADRAGGRAGRAGGGCAGRDGVWAAVHLMPINTLLFAQTKKAI
jgi:hypothetical protein